MGRMADMGGRLQSGETSFNFVGHFKRFMIASLVLLFVAGGGLAARGLNLGVEFEGGAVFEVRGQGVEVSEVREIIGSEVSEEPKVQKIGTNGVRAETAELTPEKATEIRAKLAKETGVPAEEITTSVVGPSWGGDVTDKAVQSLIIFLALLAIYLALVFEWKLAFSAIFALLHDIVATVGIYALVGFTVSPATVIGLLTILGYSLYDTVVVYDKLKENTKDLTATSKRTYSTAANLAINQTLVRSVNTTVIAVIPVGALLFVGAGLLGAGVLKDLALVLFIGMIVGAYSSICLAVPLVAWLKEKEPAMQAQAKRVAQREAAERKAGTRTDAAEPSLEKAPVAAPAAAARPAPAPGERVQPKKGGSREARQKKGPQI